MARTTMRPSNIQYHAGGAGMMGKPSLPIDSDSTNVSIELMLNLESTLIKDVYSCLYCSANWFSLTTVKIEEMS